MSSFNKGLTLDSQVKYSKVVFENKSNSNIFFEDSSVDLGISSARSSNKKHHQIAADLLNRNPLKGDTLPDQNTVSRKKAVEYKPSKILEDLNKKQLFMHNEMKSLEEMKKTRKYKVMEQRLKSSVFDSFIKQDDLNQTETKALRAQGTFNQTSKTQMNSLLSYKGVPKFREEQIQSKINQESHKDALKNTLQQIINMKTQPKMTKSKELASNIF
ncbi:UNKNOWN [Stylonychia lemnae]|uniref:Uncharacterized protein n=1 Tax=Stylonychia lemnae TaxID=5949 RepID=A0A078A7H2_STYLE|nr:UNKNOWN [Stylonychia lemnae]|eukprot:CDW77497.1 UNKNOWN [Stylonychia lemnae]